MVLETDRLTLREYVTEDFDALFEIVSDIETIRQRIDSMIISEMCMGLFL